MLTTEKILEQLIPFLPAESCELGTPGTGDPWLQVKPDRIHETCSLLKDREEFSFDLLILISGVDWKDRLTVAYHLRSLRHGHTLVLKADLSRANPRIRSTSDVWPAANWHEREAYDMFGILFDEHPEMRRILLPLDWEGYPLRKDYEQPKEYHGVDNE